MKKLLICSILSCLTFHVSAVDIKMDSGMTEGEPSYIYCDVGSVAAGVNFFTEPDTTAKGGCLGPRTSCSSTNYDVEHNTTGVSLVISSVDVSREEGIWYCQHGTDRSINTISLNNHTISGFLLKKEFAEPTGLVHEFTTVMTLSCTNKEPIVRFLYQDSESNTGTVPTNAVTLVPKPECDGISCENENRCYEITLKARNSLEVFNNKRDVKLNFTYYGNNVLVGVTVSFEAFQVTSGGLRVWEIVIIVVVVVLVILAVVIIICCLKKKKKYCFSEKEDKPTSKENTSAIKTINGLDNSKNGPEPPISLITK